MSLGLVIAGPEGLVLAAESRVTLTTATKAGQPQLQVNFDNATKLLAFSSPQTHVAAVTYGQAAIGTRTASSFLPEFEEVLAGKPRLAVADMTQSLSDFFMDQWKAAMPSTYKGPNMTFVVGGFDVGQPYGTVLEFQVPGQSTPLVRHKPGEFGMTWGGQRETVDRIVQGFDAQLPGLIKQALKLDPTQEAAMMKAIAKLQMPLALQAMALQDCVDLAIFFIRTTIAAQRLTVTVRGVGGPIDVATITRREGLSFVQRKGITGEQA